MTRKPPEAFLPLKSNWLHILLSLVGAEQHGYGIMQDVLERSDGKVRLWPATLYGSLKRLIQEGLIVESGDRPAPEFDDARRRYYKLTPLGQRVPDLESPRLNGLVLAPETAAQGARPSSRGKAPPGGALVNVWVIGCGRLYRRLARAFPHEFRTIC